MGMIAFNAQPILEVRKKGLKPLEMILVSLMGRINEQNHTVYANPQKEYDWKWVRGLQVCIYTLRDLNWRAIAHSIASERPSNLYLWDADRLRGAFVYLHPHPDDIEKPKAEWRCNLELVHWLPFQNWEFAWN